MMRISPVTQLVFWVMACLLYNVQLIRAQGVVTFESAGPTREVPEGSRFEVSFSLKNIVAKRFIPPDFKGFRTTGGPSEMRGAGFINGKSYSHQTWTYELEAGEPGTYTIGSATVQTDDRTLRTQPLIIRVGKARPAQAPPDDARVFVSAELDRENAWVGQQLHFQIKLYTQVGITEFDMLDLPQFDGFYAQERERFDTRTQYQTIKGQRYAIRVLHEICLFPQRAGVLKIGPARIRLGIEQPNLGAYFGSRPEIMQTRPIKVSVKPLPEPAPSGFFGAVGTYNWQVSADRDTLSTDEALTLTIAIEGNGDARRFANPVFKLPVGLEGFEPKIRHQEEYESGEQFIHTQTLEYAILPKEPGDYTLQPQLIIFDPDSNKYRNLPDTAIQIHVTKGQFYGQQTMPPDSVSNRPEPPAPLLDSMLQTVAGWMQTPWFWACLGLLTVIPALVFWLRRRARRKTAAVGLDEMSSRSAPKVLEVQMNVLNQYIRQNDSGAFYHELLKTIQELTAAYLQLEPVLLTKEILEEKLTARQVPIQTTKNLIRVWQQCEQVLFAGQKPAVSMQTVLQEANVALQQLDVGGSRR